MMASGSAPGRVSVRKGSPPYRPGPGHHRPHRRTAVPHPKHGRHRAGRCGSGPPADHRFGFRVAARTAPRRDGRNPASTSPTCSARKARCWPQSPKLPQTSAAPISLPSISAMELPAGLWRATLQRAPARATSAGIWGAVDAVRDTVGADGQLTGEDVFWAPLARAGSAPGAGAFPLAFRARRRSLRVCPCTTVLTASSTTGGT